MHPPKWNDSLLQNIQIHHYASLSKNSMSFGEKTTTKQPACICQWVIYHTHLKKKREAMWWCKTLLVCGLSTSEHPSSANSEPVHHLALSCGWGNGHLCGHKASNGAHKEHSISQLGTEQSASPDVLQILRMLSNCKQIQVCTLLKPSGKLKTFINTKHDCIAMRN